MSDLKQCPTECGNLIPENQTYCDDCHDHEVFQDEEQYALWEMEDQMAMVAQHEERFMEEASC